MAAFPEEDKNNSLLTLESSNETCELIAHIKEDLLESTNDGAKAYKHLMDQLLETKQPLKDTQLKDFHEKNLQVVKEALKLSYEEIMKIGDQDLIFQISQLMDLASQRLEMRINEMFSTYLETHERQICRVINAVDRCTDRAGKLYCEKAENFTVKGKTLGKVKGAHRRWANECMEFLNTLLKENNVEGTFWMDELEHRLQVEGKGLIAEYEKTKQNELLWAKFNEQSPLHAGILIDQNVFKIGVYSSQTNTCTEILSTVPEICFLPDRILVGQEASPYRYQKGNGWTHFDIFQLLTSRTSKYGSPFQNVTRQHTIGCIHEVIGAFLRHVLQSLVPLTENGVGRIIFTAPFILTSVVKERLQKGAIYAGLKDFRILSTLLTAAASTLHTKPITQHVFVTDIHPSYFSVAIVSMNGDSIVAKNQCGSENISECFQSRNFLEWHQSLCGGSELPIQCKNHISHIYEKAIDQVLINTQGLQSVYRIFTSNHFPLIEAIVANILRRKRSVGHISSDPTVGCPLIGASLLALQSNGRIKARDSSRYNLDLTILTSQRGEAKMHSHEFLHVNGNQFNASYAGCLFRQEKIPFSFNSNGDGTSVLFVILDEIYSPNHSIIEVCRYKIILSRGNRSLVDWNTAWLFGEELSLKPVCLMNDDGVLSLHLNYSTKFPTIINVERVYSSGECNSVCDKYFHNLDPLQIVSVNEEIAGSSRLPLLLMQTGEFNV